MKKIKLAILSILTILGLVVVFAPVPVGAVDPFQSCAANPDSTICKGQGDSINSYLKTGVNVMLFLVGALAVIMIIYSGIQYVISAGDSGKVAKAKNTLTYSIVGLVIAFLAYAIVNWVIGQF